MVFRLFEICHERQKVYSELGNLTEVCRKSKFWANDHNVFGSPLVNILFKDSPGNRLNLFMNLIFHM